MIYSINMHTAVYQFWRFVYHHEQSVIDHYARISLYTLILYEDRIARISFIMAPQEKVKFSESETWELMKDCGVAGWKRILGKEKQFIIIN